MTGSYYHYNIYTVNAKFFNNWTNQIRRGLLELSILNDIRHRRMYAYEIKRKFQKSQGLFISDGTIYHILRRLKTQRLVSTTEVKSPDGPKRKYYRLTKDGRETLALMNTYWYAHKGQVDSIEKGK